MPNDYLETEIIFEDNNKPLFEGESRIGKIVIRPKMDLHVDSIGYHFFWEARGKMITQKKVIFKEEFIRNKKVIKGESYQFDIKIKGESPVSYKGKNVEIKWKVQTLVDLRTDSYLMVRNTYLKKKGLGYSSMTKEILDKTLEVDVQKKEQNHRVKNVSRELEKSGVMVWVIFSVLSYCSVFLWKFLALGSLTYVWFGFEIILFLLLIFPHYYKANILRSIKVDTSFLENNQFAVILGLSKNIQTIKKVSVGYSIFEEVTDRRGTSEVVFKNKVFESPLIEKHQITHSSDTILDFPELAYDFIFDFPNPTTPDSYKLDVLKFNWRIKIIVYFPFGLKSTFVKKIDV